MGILSCIFVIIGVIIGAGFASRKRNIYIFLCIWKGWNNRVRNISMYNSEPLFIKHYPS